MDLLTALLITSVILGSLFAELGGRLRSTRRSLWETSLREDLRRFERQLRIDWGTKKVRLAVAGVEVTRGEEGASFALPRSGLPVRGRIDWQTGGDVDEIVLEIRDGRVRVMVRIPLPRVASS
jgi:hypothetical protein